MKITRISLYHYDWVSIEAEGFAISMGRTETGFPGRVVRVETDEGIIGWGEGVPHGAIYLEAFAGAIQPGVDILAPNLIGMDPTNVEQVCTKMDEILLGQPYIKSLIDTACWDIFGKFVGKPLYELWGGKLSPVVPEVGFLLRSFENNEEAILESLDTFRQRGYSMFQTKAAYGIEYSIRYIEFMKQHLQSYESLWFDCNRGWTVEDALRVCKAADGLTLFLEQPCETYEECRDVMRFSGVPVILDECVVKMKDLARAAVEGGIAGLNLKFDRVGGPTRAKQMRDFCVAMRIPVYPMSSTCSHIGDAVLAHLGHSTPQDILRTASVVHTLTSTVTAEGLTYENGMLSASEQPGLGLKINEDILTFLQSWE